MKRFIIFYFTFIFAVTTITAQNYGLGNTDPSVFTKYRIPETILSSAQVNTNFNYSSSNNIFWLHDDYNNYGTFSRLNSNLNYTLSPKYFYRSEKDDEQFSVYAIFNGGYSYSSNQPYVDESPLIDKTVSSELNLTASYLEYYTPSELFFSIASTAKINIKDRHYDDRSDPDHIYPYPGKTTTIYTGTKAQDYTVSFGIGYGQIRNVTPVVSAIRLQERLKQLNLINKDLSENTINNLAMQFSRSNYYDSTYSRPEKYLWQGIENALAKDDILLKGLNQFGNSYLHEVTNEIRFLRREGLAASVNLQLHYLNNYSSAESSPYRIQETSDILGNVNLNFSHQLNLNSQISAYLSLSGGPNLIDKSATIQEYTCDFNLGYDYELTDRFVMSVSNDLSLSFLNQKNKLGQEKYFRNNLSFSTDYFIEDQISLNATYSLNYSYQRDLGYIITYADNIIRVGITYYINRGIILK